MIDLVRMNNYTIYMSVEEGFEKNPVPYRSSTRIAHTLNEKGHDLHLVKPGEYDIDTMTIASSYIFNPKNEKELVIKRKRHEPEGHLFIIYGDETSKNPGLDFGLRQYEFLRELENNGNFGRFFNRPEPESRTMKPWLAEQYQKGAFNTLPIAATYSPRTLDEVSTLLKKHNELVLKPSFGCRSAGVRKIKDVNDLTEIEQNNLKEIVLQELIRSEGVEGRVSILDNTVLFTSRYYNFSAPWEEQTQYESAESSFPDEQIEASLQVFRMTGLDFGGIDWIGNTINEINGTGTGVIGRNSKGETTYDYTKDIVSFAERLARSLK